VMKMTKKRAALNIGINTRTKEQHSAEFCLSLSHSQIINERQRRKKRKKTMTINVYKDGHSQILFRDKKTKRDLCVCVYNEQHKKKKKEEFTHVTHTREERKNVSQALVSFNSLICLIK
jgi:hypothetical protein